MLRWTYNLSDEAVYDRWVHDSYFQYFCGEKLFKYKLPMDCFAMTRWRKRIGDTKIEDLLIKNLEVAKKVGSIKNSKIITYSLKLC